MNIISWNVNGVRSVFGKGFLDYVQKKSPDVILLQEVRASLSQIPPEIRFMPGYSSYFSNSEIPGYSGVGLLTKTPPLDVRYGFGIPEFDREGRVQVVEYESCIFVNVYFPNGKRDEERLRFKMDFYAATSEFCEHLKQYNKPIVVSGDYNTAHKAIDLARPAENIEVSGFLPIEREWMDQFIQQGFVDTFRQFHSEPDQYTWWSQRSGARGRNVGWRIDYHFISQDGISLVEDAWIEPEITGSDHCPVGIRLKI